MAIAPAVIRLQLFTASRLLLAIATAWVIVADPAVSWNYWYASVLLGLSEITDWTDGVFARKYKLATPLGGVFDPYMDSVSRIVIFGSLAAAGRCWWVVPAAMVFRDITVSYLRQLVVMGGGNPGARASGKWKAIIQGSGAALILLSPIAGDAVARGFERWIGLAVLAVTLWSLFDYAWGWLGKDRALLEKLLTPKG